MIKKNIAIVLASLIVLSTFSREVKAESSMGFGLGSRATEAAEQREARVTVREERRERLSEQKKQVIRAIYNQVRNQLTKRYERLIQIRASLQERIQEREAQGQNMSQAKNKLEETANWINTYNIDIEAMETKFEDLIGSDNPGKILPELRQAAKKVRVDLGEIRKVLLITAKFVRGSKVD